MVRTQDLNIKVNLNAFALVVAMLMFLTSTAQTVTQTVKGHITDQQSRTGLPEQVLLLTTKAIIQEQSQTQMVIIQ